MLRSCFKFSGLLAVLLVGGVVFLASVSVDAQPTASGTSAPKLYKGKAGPYAVKAIRTMGLSEKGRTDPLEIRVTYPTREF